MKIIIALDGTELKVSDCDFMFLCGFNWSKDEWGYYRCSNRGTFRSYQVNNRQLHWFVAKLMGLIVPKGYTIDHIDRNKENNQRSNFRAASKKLQAFNKDRRVHNKSGLLGVSFKKCCTNNPWVAQISSDYNVIHLGNFTTKELASEAYQQAKRIRDNKEIEKCQKATKI